MTLDRLRTHAWIVLAILTALFLVSVRHFWPTMTTANESIRYFFVESLVEDHTVTIDASLARHHSHNIDRAEREGHAYLDKAPGTSILALPAYLVATRVLGIPLDGPLDVSLLLMTLLACTAPALIAAVVLARFVDRPWLVPALLCATPLALYATQFFGHAPAAAALTLAFVAVEKRAFLLAGLLCSIAIACEYPVAPFAILVALLGVYRGRAQAARELVLGGLPIALALGGYHLVAFGGPLTTGYGFKANPEFAATHAQGFFGFTWPHPRWLWGITFSRERGLFFYAPWLLAAAPGCAEIARTDRARAVFLGATCTLAIVLIGSYDYWTGGDCVGPRFLVPVIPFFALAAFGVPERWHPLLAGAIGASVLQTWIAFVSFPFHPADVIDPLYTMSLPLLLAGLHAPATIPALWIVAPLLLALAALVLLAPRGKSVAIAALTAIAYVIVMIATSPGATPESLRAREMATSVMTS